MSSDPGGRLPSRAFWSRRRVLVTGHTGFKGSWLTAWLTEMGADVGGLALPEPPTVPSLWDVLGMTLDVDVRADVCSSEWQSSVQEFDPHVIIHLAAQPMVSAGYEQPFDTFQTNVMGTAKVLEVASTLTSLESVMIATTDKVYDPSDQPPYTEAARLGGTDPYSASKACAEMVAHSWPGLSVPVLTARAGNVIGGGDWGAHRLVPDLVRSWAENASAEVRRPTAIRPWQHVLEPLGGYLVYLERLTEVSDLPRSMNFGPSSRQDVAVRDLATFAAHEWAEALDLAQVPRTNELAEPTMHETATLAIDSSRAAELLGWSGRLDWRTAVSMTIGWYAAHTRRDDVASMLRDQLRQYAGLDVAVPH